MKHLVLVYCFALSFGFIELSHLNEEQPFYVLLFNSGTKRDSQEQLKVEDFQSTRIPPFKVISKRETEQPSKINPTLPYIPPIEFGRKRKPTDTLKERNVGPPYIPPIEFGRRRETTNASMKKDVDPPYIPPIEFGRKRETRQHLKEKLRAFRSKRDGSIEK